MQTTDPHEYIPQQEPFVMIGHLTCCEPKSATTETTISADNILTENGRWTTAAMIENIAQTSAAQMGCLGKNDGNVKIGVIGAIKNLKVLHNPRVGETIQTKIEITEEVFAMTLIHGKIILNEKTIAECDMTIAVQG